MTNEILSESIMTSGASSSDISKQGGLGSLGGLGGGMMGSLPPLGGPNLANSIASMKLGQRGQFGQPQMGGNNSGSGLFSGPNPF